MFKLAPHFFTCLRSRQSLGGKSDFWLLLNDKAKYLSERPHTDVIKVGHEKPNTCEHHPLKLPTYGEHEPIGGIKLWNRME